MAPVRFSFPLKGCSAEKYWHVSQTDDFRNYLAALDGNVLATLSLDTSRDAKGNTYISRTTKVTAIHNPVPKAIRKVGKLGDEFFFTVTESFWPNLNGEAHRLSFSTEPPVLANKIKASGSHWAINVGPDECELVWELDVTVNIVGIGGTVVKGVREATAEAYKGTPARVLEYLAANSREELEEKSFAVGRRIVARSRWHSSVIAIMVARHAIPTAWLQRQQLEREREEQEQEPREAAPAVAGAAARQSWVERESRPPTPIWRGSRNKGGSERQSGERASPSRAFSRESSCGSIPEGASTVQLAASSPAARKSPPSQQARSSRASAAGRPSLSLLQVPPRRTNGSSGALSCGSHERSGSRASAWMTQSDALVRLSSPADRGQMGGLGGAVVLASCGALPGIKQRFSLSLEHPADRKSKIRKSAPSAPAAPGSLLVGERALSPALDPLVERNGVAAEPLAASTASPSSSRKEAPAGSASGAELPISRSRSEPASKPQFGSKMDVSPRPRFVSRISEEPALSERSGKTPYSRSDKSRKSVMPDVVSEHPDAEEAGAGAAEEPCFPISMETVARLRARFGNLQMR